MIARGWGALGKVLHSNAELSLLFKPYRMKLLTCLIMLSVVLRSGCKRDTPPVSEKLKYLTSKSWIYEEYFTDYGMPSSTLVYKLGRTENSMDLSLNKVKFNRKGGYWEITETGEEMAGRWKFLNNETQTEVVNITGVYMANIIQLDADRLVWFDPNSGRYATMIHRQ